MKPLPKWLGWLGSLGAVGSMISSFGGFLPAKYAVIASTLAALMNALSHSLTGTGGKGPTT